MMGPGEGGRGRGGEQTGDMGWAAGYYLHRYIIRRVLGYVGTCVSWVVWQ